MRARAFAAYESGNYRELYNILESREFDPKYHDTLQTMWYQAHYKEAEGIRGRSLGEFFFDKVLVWRDVIILFCESLWHVRR